MAEPLALCVSDEVRMFRGGADSAAVFGRYLVRLLHAHKEDLVDTTPDHFARLFVERLYLVAFIEIDDLRLVVFKGAVGAPAPSAQARIGRDTVSAHREGRRRGVWKL